MTLWKADLRRPEALELIGVYCWAFGRLILRSVEQPELRPRRPAGVAMTHVALIIETKLACHLAVFTNLGENPRLAPTLGQSVKLGFGPDNKEWHGAS